MRNAPPTRSLRVPRRKPVEVRPRCLHNGITTYPHVADINELGLAVWHYRTRQALPIGWQDLIRGGADYWDMTPEEFLAFLHRIVLEADTLDNHGLSALTPETACADRGSGQQQAR
jgi:hypothetical protein